MTTKRFILTLVLATVAVALSAQSVYSERPLQALGLDSSEIERVLVAQQEANVTIRRLEADLAVQKAELARLLLDERPNMRLIERNLRESAEIEVDIRLAEIRREIAVREIVGTDRWARLVQTFRIRQQEIAQEFSTEAAARFQDLQRTIDEKQRALTDLMQERRDLLGNEEIRNAFRELQEEYLELQRVIREQL